MLEYLPTAASTIAPGHDKLFALLYYLSVLIFFLVNTVFLYFVIRYRHKPGQKAYYYHGNNLVEFTWTLLPTILFVGLGLYSDDMWRQMKYSSRLPNPDVQVDVVGQAFAWSMRYPGADGVLGRRDDSFRTGSNLFGIDPSDPNGKDDVIATGEFNLPVNKNVIVHLSAVDVLHSFFLPNFRVKQDAVPGSWINVWFNGTRAGKFELACAELCGSGHYNMRAVLNMQSEADFNKWMDEKNKAKLATLEPEKPAEQAVASSGQAVQQKAPIAASH